MLKQAELERVTIEAYNEFERAHRDLLKNDALEYWRQASSYKEEKLRTYKLAQTEEDNGGRKKW